MEFWQFLVAGAVLLVFYHVVFVVSLLKNDFGVVDVAWALSFLLLSFTGFILQFYLQRQEAGSAFTSASVLILVFTAIWALRLAGYLFYRNRKQTAEDFRYANMRRSWQPNANLHAYFKVFLLQAVLAYMIAYPVFIFHFYAAWPESTASIAAIVGGSIVFVVGFLYESIADWQKNAFKTNPENKGKPCASGLWRYSRHPNYFGESLVWWGMFFIVASQVPWYYVVWGPLLLQIFLLKVSGVNLLEANRPDTAAHNAYKEATNMWFPAPPRNARETGRF